MRGYDAKLDKRLKTAVELPVVLHGGSCFMTKYDIHVCTCFFSVDMLFKKRPSMTLFTFDQSKHIWLNPQFAVWCDYSSMFNFNGGLNKSPLKYVMDE